MWNICIKYIKITYIHPSLSLFCHFISHSGKLLRPLTIIPWEQTTIISCLHYYYSHPFSCISHCFFSFLPPQFNRIILLPRMFLQPCPHIQLSSLHFPIWGQMLLPQDSPLDSSDLLYAFIASSTSLFHFEITVDPYTVIRNNKKVSGYLLLSFSQY